MIKNNETCVIHSPIILLFMTHIVLVLCAVLFVAMVLYIAAETLCAHTHKKDTFGGWNNPCAGPCRRKGERTCCSCAKCAWYIDDNYNGRCIRRGTGPDSCLLRPSYRQGHHYRPRRRHHRPRRWFSRHNRSNNLRSRPVVHRRPGWVKDGWGRWIRAVPASSRPSRHAHRRNTRRRVDS